MAQMSFGDPLEDLNLLTSTTIVPSQPPNARAAAGAALVTSLQSAGSRADQWRDCVVDRIGDWEARLADRKLEPREILLARGRVVELHELIRRAHAAGHDLVAWALHRLGRDIEAAAEIEAKLSERAPEREVFIEKVTSELEAALKEAGIPAAITGRPKR